MKSTEVLDLLEWSGAILKGHFLLTSGKHSNQYIEKFRLLENPIALDKICSTMADIYKDKKIDLVVSAAIGGILISGGVGRYLNVKHIFSERLNGEMVFKRGFDIEKNQNILVVEDIVTTGGSINEIIDLIEKYKANIIGIVSIVDRNDKKKIFKYPYETLLNFPVESWNEKDCPDWLKKIPVFKPGSTGKND
jgi:orotate phosphoribosyltransferase